MRSIFLLGLPLLLLTLSFDSKANVSESVNIEGGRFKSEVHND